MGEDTYQWISILEPIFMGIVVILGGGVVYLWLRYHYLSLDVARLAATMDGMQGTLKRIDTTVNDTNCKVSKLAERQANIEGRQGSSG